VRIYPTLSAAMNHILMGAIFVVLSVRLSLLLIGFALA